MNAPVLITSRRLLEYIHISKLYVAMIIQVIAETSEKPVLIKIIIDDLLAKVYM